MEYIVLSTKKEVKDLIKLCKLHGYACFDYETTGLKYYESYEKPISISISFIPTSSFVVPLYHPDSPFLDNYEEILKLLLKGTMEDPSIIKLAWNAQFELKWNMKYGVKLKGIIIDVMLEKYVLDEERPHGLKETVARLMPQYAGYDDMISPYMKVLITRPLVEIAEYNALDTIMTFQLFLGFSKKVDTEFKNIFYNIINAQVLNFAESSFEGVYINREFLQSLEVKYSTKLSEVETKLRSISKVVEFDKYTIDSRIENEVNRLEEEIETLESPRSIANREERISRLMSKNPITKSDLKLFEPLNFGSPKQLIDLLYTSEYGYGYPVVVETDTGSPSTSEETLHILKKEFGDDDNFIGGLLDFRGLQKLYSTFIKGILEELPDNDYLHPSYLIHSTVTGRFSCKEPNLQQIPRVTTNPDIRKLFEAPEGYLFLEIDESQAELRFVAELSGDNEIIEMFERGHDIHTATAAKINKMTYEQLDKLLEDEHSGEYLKAKAMRKRAKTTNFGILYEEGARGLGEKLTDETGELVTQREAQKIIDDWFGVFKKIKRWIDNQHKLAHKYGFVTSIFGRKRRLPNIDSPEKGLVLQAERQSTNSMIQGPSSDYAALTSLVIRRLRLMGLLPSYLIQRLTVHDSLCYYVKPEDVHTIVKKLLEIGEDPGTDIWLNYVFKHVKIVFDASIGMSWGEVHKYDPEIDYVKYYNENKNKGNGKKN